MMKRAMMAIGAALVLTGCATPEKTVYVPMAAPTVVASSLTPQTVMLFNRTKEGRKLFALGAEFPYCDAKTGRVIVVPKWYVTDFASVPWYGQEVIDPQGPTARAAIVHDWLYTIGEPGKRQEADETFYRAMIAFGVDQFHAKLAFDAVRAGGQAGYGLKGDWLFIDPARQDQIQPPPFAKPTTGTVRYIPNCTGFKEMVMAGWKAYPVRMTPVTPPPAATTHSSGMFGGMFGK
jgi:hypothetical protein